MPLLFIQATNSKFQSCDQGGDYDHPREALEIGIRGAVAMLNDEIGQGVQNGAIEISVSQEDGTPLLRSVVSMSISPLLVAAPGGKTP